MISQEELQELLSYQSNGHSVVSIYLDADNAKESIETIKLQARGLLKEAQDDFPEDAEAIEQYLNHSYDWSKPGLAIFSSQSGNFFRAYPANVAFRNRLRVSPKPYIKPLAHLLDYYAHYGVILVDRVNGRFFEYHLGELLAERRFEGEEVQNLKQGRGSSTIGMRGGIGGGSHEEEVARRNLREIASAATAFFNNKSIRRLFLGGTAETVGQFRNLLPKQLQSCLADTFQIDMGAGEHLIRKETLTLLKKANEQREEKLVDKVVAATASGGNGVTGLDDVLQAVSDRRVQTLIISDGYRTPGYTHPESGFVVANLAKSPLSDNELTAVSDVIDTAVNLTIAQSGHVEVIADSKKLEDAGRIGAILRY